MRRVHYVLSSHWDREWYQTFQDYRYRLVQLLDRVIAGWEREELCGSFQTDGQAIVLEDYLEVRPERKAQVAQLVHDGHFKVGPWYVMPDEFLVSGESLIRNLRLGRELARQWGGQPSDAGFMCDIFGHNSQMPQILSGFGIKGAFIWRGTNLIENRLFMWRSPDGTLLPTYRFGRMAYCTFASDVRQMDLTVPRWSEEQLSVRLDAFLESENAQVPVGPMLAFDGGDHCEWDQLTYNLMTKRMEQQNGPFEIRHTTLDDYLNELEKVKDLISQVIEGELREPGLYPAEKDGQWLIPGVDSSRVPLKQANAACQSLLCSWTEPFSAYAQAAAGLPYPTGYLNVAWRWLLQNHPHDSICGCSIDAVHQDMLYRFHQSEGIANRLAAEALRILASNITGKIEENELRVVVFNPLPKKFSEVAVLDLEVPVDWPGWSEMTPFEIRPGVQIFDAQGSQVAYQRLGHTMNQPRFRIYDTAFPRGYTVNVIRVAVPLDIPPLGYTTLSILPGQPGLPTHSPQVSSLVTGYRSMTNQNLQVSIGHNGSLTILDQRTGCCFRSQLTFEDSADIGDGWNHGPATNDQVYTSTACHSDVALVVNGPTLAAFRIRTKMNLPQEFDPQTGARSEMHVDLLIDSLVTLKAGADRVEIETTVHNTIKDHRLRVLFPSQAVNARTYLADTPFDVVERSIALRPDNHLYREPEVETKPQQNWTAVYEEGRGLAVVAPGFFESAVQDTPERSVALTLFRATRRTVNTPGEPDGQVQGELKFKYAIIPLSGAPDRAGLFDCAALLSAGLRTAQIRPIDLQNTQESMARSQIAVQNLPTSGSFLALSGKVVMTSLRRTSAGLELRLFNPDVEPAQAELSLSGWPDASPCPQRAAWVNLESTPLSDPFSLDGGSLAFEVGPKQIRTLCLY